MGKEQCKEKAAVRYTWPGQDEAVVCIEHANKVVGIADAMGFYLQIVPLSVNDSGLNLPCSQFVQGE